MMTVQLFTVGGCLYGVDKEAITGIVGRYHDKVQIERLDNQDVLLLSKGRKAVVYDLNMLFYDQTTGGQGQNPHLLVISNGTEFIALHVPRLGGQVSVAEEAFQPLPPIFGQEARTICPLSLVNGTDTIILLDPKALHACFRMM